jgi:hypothetical protein
LAPRDWRYGNDEPAGLAPDPAKTPEAVVQVYGARVSGWRGIFGLHTWIAAKPSNANAYTIYEVVGWRLRWADSVVAIGGRRPDGGWYGARAQLFADARGDHVDRLIARIDRVARSYRYAGEYTVWPGPNSNTFVATIARAVPELAVEFPPTAIGKDYLGPKLFGPAPSGRGFQFSLFGLVAFTVGKVEGIEINVLTMTFGINPFSRTVKLPILGPLPIPGFGPRETKPLPSAKSETIVMAQPALKAAATEATATVHRLPTAPAEESAELLRQAA